MSYDPVRNYGPYAGPGPSYFQAFAGIRVTDETADAAYIQVSGDLWVVDGSDFYGTVANWWTWHNGEGQTSLYGSGWYPNNPWVNIGWVARGNTVSTGAAGNYVSNSGAYHSSEVVASWTVPTSGSPQVPSITVAPTIVNYAQTTTVTATYNSTWINARFWELQVEDGCGGRLATTNINSPNVRLVSDPSALMLKYGGRQGYYDNCRYAYKKLGYVYYCVRQVHEWFGTFPASMWVWASVEVKSGVVAFYDGQGKKKTGLVSVYDSKGILHPTLLSMYDSSGNVHETG